jgi:glycosyltransferase involved in cell wall biosynthesis
MRVLTLTHELPPVGGGGGRIALELARQMASLGHEVEILTAAYGDLPLHETDGNLTISRIPCGRTNVEFSTGREKLAYVWQAGRELRRRGADFDLIHTHFILPAGLIARYGPLHAPYVITCHGSDVPGHNPFESGREHALMKPLWRQVVNRAEAVVSPSANLEALIRLAAPQIGDTLRRIPNGYPAGKFKTTSGEGGILMVSRLIPLKGFQYFLEGLRGVRLDQQVNIVGDGPMRAELEALAAATPSEIVFHGWLDNDDPRLRQLFETCSIFVFPSEAENFPTVLLEAMDAGMAIVTTNVKGCPEVVGDAGLTVPPRSPAALLSAARRLVDDPAERARLGQAGKQRLLDNFDWKIVARRYADLYEAAAHGSR